MLFDIPSCASQVPSSPAGSPLVSGYSPGSEGEVQQIIQKYEEGTRGILNPLFSSLLIKWFDYCDKLG